MKEEREKGVEDEIALLRQEIAVLKNTLNEKVTRLEALKKKGRPKRRKLFGVCFFFFFFLFLFLFLFFFSFFPFLIPFFFSSFFSSFFFFL